MANTVSILSYANTFGDQMVATNALARENNDLAANNYVKRTGTLYLNDPTLGLQVSNNSIFSGQLQVTGLGSSAYIQNNLRVDTQVYFTNTVLGLTNSGQAIIGGQLSANGSNVSLLVANNTQMGGYLNVSGNASVSGPTSMANTLAVTGPVTMANTLGVTGAVSMGSTLNVTNNGAFGNNLSVVNQTNTYSLFVNTNIASGTLNNSYNVWIGGTASVMGTIYANTLQANNVVNTALMIATDKVLANFISSNTTVTGNTVVSKGFTYSNTLQVTTNSFTGNLNIQYATVGDSVIANTFMASPIVSSTIVSATNIVYANYLQANSTVNAATSTVTGNSYTNILIGNTSVLTPIVSSTTINNSGINYTNVLQANTLANAATLTVSGAAYVNNVQANTNIYTPALSVLNTLYGNNIQANTNVNTPSVTSVSIRNTGTILSDILQANTSVNTATLSVTGTTYTNYSQANTNVNTPSITSVSIRNTGVALTDILQANTNVNTPSITSVSIRNTGTILSDILQANTNINTPSITSVSIRNTGTILSDILQANTSVNTATLSVTGTTYTNYSQANTNVNTPSVTSVSIRNTGVAITDILQANTSVNTATLSVTGTSYVNYSQANTNVNTPSVTSISIRNTGTILSDLVQANTNVNTPSVTANNANIRFGIISNTMQANTLVNTSILTATNSIIGENIRGNTGFIGGALALSGTATVDTLVANTLISVPSLSIATSITACNATIAAKSITVGTGGLSVLGDFTINGTTIYNSPTFTLSSATPNQYGYINVYRTSGSGANASIKWDQGNTYWTIADVSTGANSYYYRILTTQQIVDNVYSTSTTTAASANVANTLNNYVVTNVISLQSQISSNVTSLQSQISSNVALINGVDSTQNTWISAAIARANSSSQSFNGTTGSATPTNPAGLVTFTSTNGMTITGSGSTLTINSPQNLRTTDSPTFNGLTLTSATLTNALAVIYGGTGGTSAATALTNLLPTYDSSKYGYVLGTYGPGNYQWVAGGTGGGGGGSVQPGTTINSSKLTYTGNGTGLAYTTPVYVPGSEQLRVYINGLRVTSGYTETSGNTGGSGIVTFGSSPAVSSSIVLEVDGYILNPYYANNITFTAPQGGIVTSANTIQLAIQDLESRKATLASPSFTGSPTSTTPLTVDSSTQIATTAFVKNALNNSNTYTISVSGNAGTATTLQTARTINGVSFDGSAAITVTAAAGTLTGGTLNSTVVSSSLTSVGTIATGVWNGSTIPVAYGGTGVTVSTGSGFAVLNTSPILLSPTLITPTLGTPASGNFSTGSFTWPTFNQNTTGNAGTATTLTTARTINGVSFDGSAAITVTAAAGTLTGTTLNSTVTASSLTSVGTIATGVWNGSTIAVLNGGTGVTVSTGSGFAVLNTSPILLSPTLVTPILGTPQSGNLSNCTFPTLNQSTTGSAATLTTPRAINGVSFDGSAAITVTAAAGTLTGTTLNSTVVSSSLTSVGTITSGVWNGSTIAVLNGGTGTTTSTGTGSVVLSTSPTLVTPILGTPQSGNLSNCTFPTLNQSTTGNAATTSQTNFSNLTIAASQVLSAANFNSYAPTLTGTGVSGTWGISITGSAAQLTGLVPQTSGAVPTANQILRADNNGYTTLGYINSNTSNNENPTISQVIVTNGSDNYYRKSSISSFTSTIQSNASGTWGINISGNATTATSAGSATTATTATTANALNTGNSYSGTYFQTSSGYAAQFGGSAAVGFYLDATNSAVRAPTTGSIYMQSASGTYTYGIFSSSGLSVTGTITASSNITAYSDERIKCNWKDLSSTFVTDLAKVKSGTFERLDMEGTQVGVSAQSLQKVMPEAVVEDSDGTLSVAYGNAALAASVELAKEIVLMKEMIKQLHAEIEVLKSTK